MEDIEELLRDYVERNSGICCAQWDPAVSERLLFDPYDADKRAWAAHYFLLNASVTETALIGRAENARALMVELHRRYGDALLRQTNAQLLNEAVRGCGFYRDFRSQRLRIGAVLAGVNRWVEEEAGGDLLGYSGRFSSPSEYARVLQGMPRMGGRHCEKVWMYLRWLTRPYPDLGVYHFDVRDLRTPLTSYVVSVAACLGMCEEPGSEQWKCVGYREEARERVTGYASRLFPDDPLRVDYPFYMLGRWMEGQRPCVEDLRDYLVFFDELYRLTGTVPVTYDIVGRETSGFERSLRGLLERQSMVFYFEPQRFSLGGGLTYKPDFVLPGVRVGGRTVVLEPHGVWGGDHELEVTRKYRLFREMFGSLFYLILIVPPLEYVRVRDGYPESYDDIVEGNRMGDLLYMLKSGRYKQIF
ncbi:MAG: DUF2400 family protein [Candidatus Bathyarchaeota archaeon]